jgi:hypothetical protein
MRKEQFLFYDTGLNDQERVTVFTTPAFLKRLENSECWLGDATFKSTPKNYKQLFILHGYLFKKHSLLLLS